MRVRGSCGDVTSIVCDARHASSATGTDIKIEIYLFRNSKASEFAFRPYAYRINECHVYEMSVMRRNILGRDDRFAGDCDANGCDYNHYRMRNTDFYGKCMTLDTRKTFP